MAGRRLRGSNEARLGRARPRRGRVRARAMPAHTGAGQKGCAIVRAVRKLIGRLQARRLKQRRASVQRMMQRRWRLWNRRLSAAPPVLAAPVAVIPQPEVAAPVTHTNKRRRRSKLADVRARRHRR